MKLILAVAICGVLLAALSGKALGQSTPIIVLADLHSATVKIVDPALRSVTGPLQCSIREWPDGALLSDTTISEKQISADDLGNPSFVVSGLSPLPWTLQDPRLYTLQVRKPAGILIGSARFGFRVFDIKDRKFHLNGRPIFLRGMPINPPGRDLPEETGKDPKFIRDYLRLLKAFGMNSVRVEADDWQSACDEIGLLTFQGRYGPSPGGTRFDPPAFETAVAGYRDLFCALANHPSVVIYILTNEVDYPKGLYKPFLTRVREYVRQLDPTRPVIGNAGYGMGEPGEIWDLHRYSGWYYDDYVTWYDLPSLLAKADAANQPFTLTECVGAYTADDGKFLSMRRQMPTMLRRVGPAQDMRAASMEYQAEQVREVVEIARRQRTATTGVGGVMPFTYFIGWTQAHAASDLILKPAFQQLKVSFQPVLISPECWTRNVYSGDPLRARMCIVNDDDDGRDVQAGTADIVVLSSGGTVVNSLSVPTPAVPYYKSAWVDAAVPIPASTPKGHYLVKCTLTAAGKPVSHNEFQIFAAPREWTRQDVPRVHLFDPSGRTAKAFAQVGIPTGPLPSLKSLPQGGCLVIGQDAITSTSAPDAAAVRAFTARGGRILCLNQNLKDWTSAWLPADFQLQDRDALTYIHPVGGNAQLFDDTYGRNLRLWNRIADAGTTIPDIWPVRWAFAPAKVSDLKNARIWAACDHMLSGAAVVELFQGKGSILLSQLRCVERVGTDPAAARMLSNLVRYAASDKHAGLLELSQPVRWDLSAMRSGAFASPVQGFFPHSATFLWTGETKGRTGEDQTIDGCTLVGPYTLSVRAAVKRKQAPEVSGVFFGTLTKSATGFSLTVRNLSSRPAKMTLLLDGALVSSARTVRPRARQTLEWDMRRGPGPVQVELRGDPELLISQSAFR